MDSKINQNDDYFFGNLEIQFQIQNFLFFENFTVDFQIQKKKNYQVNLLSVFQYLHINLNVLRNVMALYWGTGLIRMKIDEGYEE